MRGPSSGNELAVENYRCNRLQITLITANRLYTDSASTKRTRVDFLTPQRSEICLRRFLVFWLAVSSSVIRSATLARAALIAAACRGSGKRAMMRFPNGLPSTPPSRLITFWLPAC